MCLPGGVGAATVYYLLREGGGLWFERWRPFIYCGIDSRGAAFIAPRKSATVLSGRTHSYGALAFFVCVWVKLFTQPLHPSFAWCLPACRLEIYKHRQLLPALPCLFPAVTQGVKH